MHFEIGFLEEILGQLDLKFELCCAWCEVGQLFAFFKRTFFERTTFALRIQTSSAEGGLRKDCH